MSKLMTGAEFAPGAFHALVDVDDRPIAKSDDLSLASDQASISNFGPNAQCDRPEIDVTWLVDTQIYEKLFRGTHEINPSGRHFR
jgi:hypothetical protein